MREYTLDDQGLAICKFCGDKTEKVIFYHRMKGHPPHTPQTEITTLVATLCGPCYQAVSIAIRKEVRQQLMEELGEGARAILAERNMVR